MLTRQPLQCEDQCKFWLAVCWQLAVPFFMCIILGKRCPSVRSIIVSYVVFYFTPELVSLLDFEHSPGASALSCAIIAHHSTCMGDTLASELGILSKSAPFLISAPWRKVPPGTNGGITVLGTFWSAVGGCLMGLGTLAMDLISGFDVRPVEMIIFSSACGLLGSFLDSLLGATLQISLHDHDKKITYAQKEGSPPDATHICGYDLLSNAQVNLVSVIVVTGIGGCLFGQIVF